MNKKGLFSIGEMANAYSELNDQIDQRERFKAQEALLALGDEEANTTDEDFMRALEIGMRRACEVECDEARILSFV